MLNAISLGAIWSYQKFISPHKGFRCAHSVLQGGTGCSGFAKACIKEHGLIKAIPLIRGRLKECGELARAHKAKKQNICCDHGDIEDDIEDLHHEDGLEGGRRKRKDHCDPCDGCGDAAAFSDVSACFFLGSDVSKSTPKTGVQECASCDAKACDTGGCNGCDIGSCDGGCDIGGCGS